MSESDWWHHEQSGGGWENQTQNTSEDQDQVPSSTSSNGYTSKLFESTVLVTIAVAGMYCVGWIFVDQYLHELGIPHQALNLPTDYYLRYGALPVITFAIAVAVSLSKGSNQPNKVSEAFSINVPWLILILILCSLMFYLGGPMRKASYFYSVMLGGAFLILTGQRYTFGYLWRSGTLYRRVFIIGSLFFLALLTSGMMGGFVAKGMRENRALGKRRFRFEAKDDRLASLKDKEFILVIYHEDLYYLIESKFPIGDNPAVLVVPKDEIRYATIVAATGNP